MKKKEIERSLLTANVKLKYERKNIFKTANASKFHKSISSVK